MMNERNEIRYGSQGSDVTELQKLLNGSGYQLDEDGIFGEKTQSAVKDYQRKNNLTVDGIVGANTWDALTKASGTDTTQNGDSTTPEETPQFSYEPYKPGEAVTQAQQLLQQQAGAAPQSYQSQWQTQLNDTVQKILNREPFSYDLNADALYQQYRDQYVRQGQLAMLDTMGQAQTMTGGYGNSYAQTAGQQAYEGYLQRLNEVAPELYGMALERYNQEGQALLDQYGLLNRQEEAAYGRYQDQLRAWLQERDYLADRYDSERQYDYEKYLDDLAFAYGQERDKVSDEQWQAEFDEAVRQFDFKNGIGVSGGSGGSGGGSGSGKYKEEAKQRQQLLAAAGFDVTVDGHWDMASEKAWTEYVAQMDIPRTTYAQVATAAAMMAKMGESKTAISKYLNKAVARENYRPTLSVQEDLEALRSAFIGSGR